MIPLSLVDRKINIKANFQLNDFKRSKYGEFCLNTFLNRYLAGNRSLKESRSLSRKRLALVTSHIGYLDPEAVDLVAQMNNYENAKKIFSSTSTISIETLLDANKLVASENIKSGSIREMQNWIGGDTPNKALHVPPPPEYLDELINDWLAFVNCSSLAEEVIAIIGHNQLLSIHPFTDGNGRVARLFLHVLLEKKYGDIIHPILYRIHEEYGEYINAINSTLEEEGLSNNLHDFWNKSLLWGNNLMKKLHEILEVGQSEIFRIISLRPISKDAQILIGHLWSQPIVCELGLFKHFGWNFYTSQSAIKELINANLLFPRKLRQPENAIIYDCPLIFDVWKELDNLIFSYKE